MEILGSLIVGVTSGGLFAVIGVLLTLMAMLTRVVNFAQVAVGVFGAYVSIRIVPANMPDWLTVVVAIAIAAALSAGIGWIIVRWLGSASTTARSAVTVAALLGLMALAVFLFGTRPQPLTPLIIGPAFSIGTISVTKVGLVMVGLALVIAAASHALLKWTPFGVQLRAISDRQMAAELLGINVQALQIGVWAVTGALSGLIISLVGNSQAASAGSMAVLLIPAAAAALVGAFQHLWVTVAGGLLVGALQGILTAFPSVVLLKDWIPIFVIIAFLLWNQRKEVWDVAR